MLFFHALQSALVRISTGLMFVGLAVAFASGKASARPAFLIRPENAASDIRERSVAVMRETRDGYLWLGTAFGLVRFDGVTFTNFATQGTPGAVPDSIAANSLWEDQAGVLWAGTEGQGVLRNDHGRFLLFTDRTGLPDDDIVRVDGDASGAVWIFTAHGVVRVRGDNFEKVDPLKDGGPGAVPLRFDDRRTPDTVHMGLWRKTPAGIERFAYGHWQTFPTPPGRGATFYKDIRSIYEDALHRVWYSLLSERGRYFCVENGRLQVYEGVPRDAFVSYRDSEGYLWLNDHKGHAARWRKGTETSLAPFESPFFLHVVERSDGWFWLSARHSALFLLRRRAVATLPTFGAPEVGAVLYQARDGKVWAGGLGLQLHRGGTLLPFPLTPPLRDMNYLNALGEDRAGHLLYNLRDASHLRQLRGHTQLPEPPYPAVSQAVHHMLLDHLGQQWLATDKGLLLLKPGDPPGAVQTVASEVVNCLLETAPGHLWAGTQTGPIEIAGEAVQPLPLSAHWSYGAVTSMDVDETGSLWIGTVDSGVVRYRNGHFEAFTKADGLPTNFVGTVQAGDPHALWLKTDTGLLRLERSGVEDKLSDRTRGLSLSRFGEEDGLPSALMYPFGNEGSLRLSDGTLWFSTTGGIAALQPWRMPHPETIPRTLVEEHAIDQSGLRSGAPVVMQPGQDSLELHYTALGSQDPAELKFRYRLFGIDSGWVQAGVRRVAYYTRLPPGTYRFEVQAADGDGDTWDTTGASTEVRVLAPWYRTLWFRALALGVVLAALLAILWRRQRRELIDKQQKQAFTRLLLTSQEAERKRIAHDLHDGLGQHLALIANLAQLHRKWDLPAGAKGGLEQIQAEAGVAMDEVEAISYNLRPYQLDRLGLTNAVLSLVRGLEEATGLEVVCEVANIDSAFPKDLEINFYRIVQESLSNIARHARATRAEIRVVCESAHLHLFIRDNGMGFSTTASAGVDGLGLVGIGERAELLGGTAVIDSSEGLGTTVIVHVNRSKVGAS